MERISRIRNRPRPESLPKPLAKIFVLVLRRYANAIILADDQEAVCSFLPGKFNPGHMVAVPERIVDEVVEHFFNHAVGKDLGISQPYIDLNPLVVQLSGRLLYHRFHRVPRGCLGPDLLVVLREGDLVLDRHGGQFQFLQCILEPDIFGIFLCKIDIHQECKDPVGDVMPGDLGEEVEFLVCRRKGRLDFLPFGNIVLQDRVHFRQFTGPVGNAGLERPGQVLKALLGCTTFGYLDFQIRIVRP